MAKTEYTNRQVIEGQILMALDDQDKVVIILNEREVGVLIQVMERVVADLGEEPQRMLKDLRELARAAFQGKGGT